MLVAKELSTMPMETNIQEIGKTTNAMAMVYMKIKKVQDTRVIGKMTRKVVKEKRLGQRALTMRDSIKTERRKDLVSTLGPTDLNTKASG